MEYFIAIIQYLLFHAAVSITLFIIIDKNKEKSQKYFKKRFYKIKESQHLVNYRRLMTDEDIIAFKERYKEDGLIDQGKDSPIKFFIYGWAFILFFIIFSYISEHLSRNLKIKIEKEEIERRRQEQLEVQAYKDLITSREDE